MAGEVDPTLLKRLVDTVVALLPPIVWT